MPVEMMVVLIVLIVGVTSVMRAKHGVIRTKSGEMYVGPPRGDDGENERLRDELRLLRDRVQVLERIVTDGDRDRAVSLEREIEQLRDARREREVRP